MHSQEETVLPRLLLSLCMGSQCQHRYVYLSPTLGCSGVETNFHRHVRHADLSLICSKILPNIPRHDSKVASALRGSRKRRGQLLRI